MEVMGLVAFVFVMFYMGLPDKVKRLGRQVAALKRESTGVNEMSSMLKGLTGTDCVLKLSDGYSSVHCRVLEVDDEWLKVLVTDKKFVPLPHAATKLLRVSAIDEVTVVDQSRARL